MKEKEKTPVKVKVTEKDFNFLKKVQGLRDEILIKKSKIKEKGAKEEKEVMTTTVVDESSVYMVQAVQFNSLFNKESFGMKDIKAFLKSVTKYGEFEEQDLYLVFGDGKKKISYKKLDESTLQQTSLPVIDTAGYISIPLEDAHVKAIQEGLKNELSDYASLRITPENKLVLKIGELSYDNLYEEEIKDVVRKDPKDKSEVKFLTKLKQLSRLFSLLDSDSKSTLFLKTGSPLIFIEKSETLHTKTFIAPVADDDDEDRVDEVIDAEDEMPEGEDEE
jgi:hypothetical protein